MQGSTVVINPPDGNLRQYLASLDALGRLGAAILAPGHGYLIGDPGREAARLIAHRLARETKVLAALGKLGGADLSSLVRAVYDDVDARIHPVAARSLVAHLEKLVGEGAVRDSGGHFSLVQSAGTA
jgi:glyoxylase-like metal-dependent hydrolase (beta-lactamase superfamily II)